VQDELLWGSAWLLWATKNTSYLADVLSLGASDGVDMFSWDNKPAGARILLSRVNKHTSRNISSAGAISFHSEELKANCI
jgi:hypothetical protein